MMLLNLMNNIAHCNALNQGVLMKVIRQSTAQANPVLQQLPEISHCVQYYN